MTRRALWSGLAAALLWLGLPATRAGASFHIMVIQEVFPGTTARPDAQFVELRMRAGGQNQVAGRTIRTFNADGSDAGIFAAFSSAVPNGARDGRILACTSEAQALFDLTCDAMATGRLPLPSGKVAFETVDAVAYGRYTGSDSGVGTPAGAAVRGRSLDRIEDAGVPRDTNDSRTDFRYAAPTPATNAGATGSLPAGDADGDGVPDGADNCPDRDNPGQADADGNGLGDACQEEPPPPPPPPCRVELRHPLTGERLFCLPALAAVPGGSPA